MAYKPVYGWRLRLPGQLLNRPWGACSSDSLYSRDGCLQHAVHSWAGLLCKWSVGIYSSSTVGDLDYLLLCQVFIVFLRLLEMILKVFHQMVCTWNFHNISSVWHLHRNKNMYGNNHSYAYCFLTQSLKYIPSKTKILHLHQVFLEK